MEKTFKNVQNFEQHTISINEEYTYEDMENLAKEVQNFIESKGFKILDKYEFLTSLNDLLYEGIDKRSPTTWYYDPQYEG
jgi:predicted metalloprotease with PDZ domain